MSCQGVAFVIAHNLIDEKGQSQKHLTKFAFLVFYFLLLILFLSNCHEMRLVNNGRYFMVYETKVYHLFFEGNEYPPVS